MSSPVSFPHLSQVLSESCVSKSDNYYGCLGSSASFCSGCPDFKGYLHLLLGLTPLSGQLLAYGWNEMKCETCEPGWMRSPCVQSWYLTCTRQHSPISSVPQPWSSYCCLGNCASCFLSSSRFIWVWKYFSLKRERVDDALPTWKQSTGRKKTTRATSKLFSFLVSSVGSGG